MTHEFFCKFSKKYKNGLKAKKSYSINRIDIEWADIVLSIRPTNIISTWIAEECRRCNKIHISMYDDNLLNHLRTDRYMVRRKNELGNIIRKSQILLTTNNLLTSLLQKIHPEIRTAHIDTVVDEKCIKQTKKQTEKTALKLVYYSNDGTTHYFESFMPEVIKKIVAKLPDTQIQLDLIGVQHVNFNLGKCEIHYVPHMGYSDFKNYLKNGDYIAGISPIVIGDNFSKYKYFNKFIEYTCAGIVGIYTNAEPYTFEIVDGQNGFLCDNNIDSWTNCIIRLFESPTERYTMLKNAYKTLEEKHSFDSVARRLLIGIPELIGYQSPKKKVRSLFWIKTRYSFFYIGEKINATVRYLKNGGVKSFFNRTNQYIHTMAQIAKERKNAVAE